MTGFDCAALDALFEPLAHRGAPGLVVGVAHRNEPIYRQAFGDADIEAGLPNTVDTMMALGSVTKMFTAFAALLLAEASIIDLDASIRTWLPELPILAGEATLRQLLEHRSGYRDYLDAEFISGMAMRPAGAALAFQVAQRGVDFAPGVAQVYNNSGYHLASLVLERVCGQPLETVLAEHVFAPLGMTSTRLLRNDAQTPSDIAVPYEARQGSAFPRGFHVFFERLGDGAAYSTIDDMLRWCRELRGPHRLGRPALWDQFKTPRVRADGSRSHYALGLQLSSIGGLNQLGHGGATIGARALVVTLADEKLDIVMLANTVIALESLVRPIIEAVLGEKILSLPLPPPAAADYAKLLGRYYAAATGKLIEIVDAEGSLAISTLGSAPMLPTSCPAGAYLPFEMATPTGPMHFAEDIAGLVVADGGEAQHYGRLDGTMPTAAEVLEAAAGRYVCEDNGGSLELGGNAASLRIDTHGRHGTSWLAPARLVAADLLVVDRLERFPFAATIALIRDKAGSVTELTVTTARTRKLRFMRQAA